MYDTFKLLHLVAAIVWMGGMTFMLLALKPAAMALLEPQPRARLMGVVWQRFFVMVLIAIVVLLVTGTHLYTAAFKATKAATGVGSVALGWNAMLVLGMTMVLIFGHIYFAGFKRFKRAAAAGEWPVAAKAAAQIQTLVLANFVLGWLAIAAVRLLH
ncbi:MAG: CopD family protein [Rhodoferax sp.]